MNEYATQAEIDQMLGLTSEKDGLDDLNNARLEVIGRETTPDSLEANSDEVKGETTPTPELEDVAEPSNDELRKVRSRLASLEKGQHEIDNTFAELKGGIKLSATVLQVEQAVTRIDDLENRLSKFQEILKDVIEPARCPDCQNLVGWNTLPEEWYSEMELRPEDQLSILPMLTTQHGKLCPLCRHFKAVKKVEGEVE